MQKCYGLEVAAYDILSERDASGWPATVVSRSWQLIPAARTDPAFLGGIPIELVGMVADFFAGSMR